MTTLVASKMEKMEMGHWTVRDRRVNGPIQEQLVLIKVVSCGDLRTPQIRYSATLPLSRARPFSIRLSLTLIFIPPSTTVSPALSLSVFLPYMHYRLSPLLSIAFRVHLLLFPLSGSFTISMSFVHRSHLQLVSNFLKAKIFNVSTRPTEEERGWANNHPKHPVDLNSDGQYSP